MKQSIVDAATIIRSKNAGPFELTLDIFLKNRQWFDLFKKRRLVSAERIARLYGIQEADVLSIIYFEPANAIKITIKRWCSSGAPGDVDVYGAQQHAPLLDIEIDLEC